MIPLAPIYRWAAVLVSWLSLVCADQSRAAHPPGLVVAWGDNTYGQTNVPPGLGNVIGVAGGYYHTLALKEDATVVAWGGNFSGQTDVPSDLTNVVAIAAGDFHSLALKRDQTVVAWGAGKIFRPSDLTNFGQSIVPKGLSGVTAIAAGSDFSLALKTNGTVVAWGFNLYGQTAVPSIATNIVAIAASGYHCLALKDNGTVVAWGFGGYGETNVPVELTNVVAIAAGWNHHLALSAQGKVTAWGYNNRGQTNPPPGLTAVEMVASGGNQRVVLNADGSVVAWGWIKFIRPPEVPIGLPPADAVAAGVNHLLLLTSQPFFQSRLPSSSSLEPGTGVNLGVTIQSATPVDFQWALNGSPLRGATQANLAVAQFDLVQAGIYSVVATSQYGRTTNTTVLRLVHSPVVLVDGVDIGGGVLDRAGGTPISMSSPFGTNGSVYYTLDGSPPDFTSIPYIDAFSVTHTATIRAVAYNVAFSLSAEAAPIDVRIAPMYSLTVINAGGGTVATSPFSARRDGPFASNSVVTLTATPTNGWSFLGWSGASTDSSNVTQIVMTAPRTVAAIFGTSLNLLTNGTGGILLDPNLDAYPLGSVVRVMAVPGAGSYLFGWANATNGFDNPILLPINRPTLGLTALFAPLGVNQVSLQVLPDIHGSVTVSPHQRVYTRDQSVSLTAIPSTNYLFSRWGGDASGATNPLVLSLATSAQITASFISGILSTNPPRIVQSPRNQTTSGTQDVELSVVATGDGRLVYQWNLNGMSLVGATNDTLRLGKISVAQTGVYNVVVTASSGLTTTASASVALLGLQIVSSSAQALPLLLVVGPTGRQYTWEFADDLTTLHWTPLTVVTLSNTSNPYIDLTATNRSTRFYRLIPR